MRWMTPGDGVVTTVGVTVGKSEPIALVVSRSGGARLSVEGVEILLTAGQVVSLVEQARPVLAGLRELASADTRLAAVEVVGGRVASAAQYARAQAEAAQAAGAEREATAARHEAGLAVHAMTVLAAALDAAYEAMDAAEAVLERVGEAAATARVAAGGAVRAGGR